MRHYRYNEVNIISRHLTGCEINRELLSFMPCLEISICSRKMEQLGILP